MTPPTYVHIDLHLKFFICIDIINFGGLTPTKWRSKQQYIYIYNAPGCILLTKCTQANRRARFGAATDRPPTEPASQPRQHAAIHHARTPPYHLHRSTPPSSPPPQIPIQITHQATADRGRHAGAAPRWACPSGRLVRRAPHTGASGGRPTRPASVSGGGGCRYPALARGVVLPVSGGSWRAPTSPRGISERRQRPDLTGARASAASPSTLPFTPPAPCRGASRPGPSPSLTSVAARRPPATRATSSPASRSAYSSLPTATHGRNGVEGKGGPARWSSTWTTRCPCR
jgi:hypothetical protein